MELRLKQLRKERGMTQQRLALRKLPALRVERLQKLKWIISVPCCTYAEKIGRCAGRDDG